METELRTNRRPDGRVVAWPDGEWTPGQAMKAVEHSRANGVTVIVHLAADRARESRILIEAGFTATRRDVIVEIDLDTALADIGDSRLPDGVAVISAADADLERLRHLDDALRDDIPGTAGWRSTPEEFAESFTDPEFDPRTYLAAVDERSGEYVGLVRVWMNRPRPRIGMFGALKTYRRQGITLALLARCFRVARDDGHRTATSEFDESNEASRGVFERLRSSVIGSTTELMIEPPRSPDVS